MARRTVHVERELLRPAEAVWVVLSDFCGRWHPFIDRMDCETDARGGVIRAFIAAGEDKLYRERLTWFSDSDRSLGYTHLEGIEGVQTYDGMVRVLGLPEGRCKVVWTASIEAEEPRLGEIAAGTEGIFETGLKALSGGVEAAHAEASPLPARAALRDLVIDGAPRLALTAAGPERGRRLCLFLHGIGGGRGNWDRQVALAGSLMPAAALDLRGYGGSERGPEQSGVDDYCADILRVMQQFGAERLVLVGLSYGAWIATSFAMRYPHLLDGLVLSGGCTGMSEAPAEERERFRLSRQVPLDEGRTPADFAPAVVDVLAGPEASAKIRAALLASMSAIPAATYRDALTCFTNPPERFDFAKLAMPVLMMTGEHDRLASPDEIRGVAERIHAASPRPDMRFEVIAGAGHVCNLEQPEHYDRLLASFLKRLPA